MKIAIIGAGWYGCHIASSFKALGLEVVVFEQETDLLSAASGNNQFRLHQGFHYARNYRTRVQSRDGYHRFMERYARLTAPVDHNLYAVPNQDSLIDFLTYRLIMSASGLEFKEVDPENFGVTNCDGALLTDERVILTQKAREFFKNRLENSLRLGHRVEKVRQFKKHVEVDGEKFDYVIDATWGAFTHIKLPIFFEPTLLFYYRVKTLKSFALTTVDGPLCSIYPTEDPDIVTLSSVPYTPLGQFNSAQEAWEYLRKLETSVIADKRRLMEDQVKRYFPGFSEEYEYLEPQLSVKTKIFGATDDRSCYIQRKGRVISVMSGKIDTIFYATNAILGILEKDAEEEVRW